MVSLVAGSGFHPGVIHRMATVTVLAAFIFSSPAHAKEIRVPPGQENLQRIIDSATPGSTLILPSATFSGPVIIDKKINLTGSEKTVIDGGGQGRVVTVDAPDVVLRNLQVSNSGDSLATEDSGIFVTENGDRVLIEKNLLRGNLIGINLKGPEQAVVRNNIVYGSQNPHINDRGNGVHIWNAPGALVEGNRISYGRDGIFVTTSKHNSYRNNRFENMRFAIHYMYTSYSEVSGNISIGNHSAYALMFSDYLRVFDNVTEAARDRGLFLNAVNYSELRGNKVTGGTEKCVFIYNANSNLFESNHFEACEIGIHFTAGSENNTITANRFIGNRTQVKYVGTRHIEWSAQGIGNYWSDNPAFDLDRDGIADQIYRPNDIVDQIVWRHPLAKLLLNSPTTQLLRWAQSRFPSLHPGGVTDSAALMKPLL